MTHQTPDIHAPADPATEPAIIPCLITDQLLRHLARPDPGRDRGELTPGDTAVLVVTLTDICNELLTRRAADLTICRVPGEDQQNLAAARLILRSPDPVDKDVLVTACQTILNLSRDTIEQNCACDVLAQLGVDGSRLEPGFLYTSLHSVESPRVRSISIEQACAALGIPVFDPVKGTSL